MRQSSYAGFEVFYLHTDQLGSIQTVIRAKAFSTYTDFNNNLVYVACPNALGDTRTYQGWYFIQNGAFNMRNPGQYFDSETGFLFNNARYFNPRIGAFISADPLGKSGGTNVYAYGSGSLLNDVDESGLADFNFFRVTPAMSEIDANAHDRPILEKGADNWNPPGFLSVAGHGSRDYLYTNVSPKSVGEPTNRSVARDPDGLAKLLEPKLRYKNPNYPVILGACSTGSPGSSPNYAQHLANKTKHPVYAPVVPLLYNESGLVGYEEGTDRHKVIDPVAVTDYNNKKIWQIFYPSH